MVTNAGSRTQKIADETSLPRGEAASEPCASQPLLLTLLVSDEIYRLFQRGWLARIGVGVTAIAKIGRREYFWQCTRTRAPGAGELVLGQAPASIERSAKAVDTFARRERFEAKLASHHIDIVDLVEQGPGVDIFADHLAARMLKSAGKVPLLFTRNHIGMNFDQHFRLGGDRPVRAPAWLKNWRRSRHHTRWMHPPAVWSTTNTLAPLALRGLSGAWLYFDKR